MQIGILIGLNSSDGQSLILKTRGYFLIVVRESWVIRQSASHDIAGFEEIENRTQAKEWGCSLEAKSTRNQVLSRAHRHISSAPRVSEGPATNKSQIINLCGL